MQQGSRNDVWWWSTQALTLCACILMAVAYLGCGDSGIFGHGSNSQIGGTVVVATVSGSGVTPTSTVVPGATVWLEQQSRVVNSQGGGSVLVENLIQTTSTTTNGQFQFSAMPNGTYEIVADVGSMPTTKAPSNATISTGIVVNSSGAPSNLKIPLVADIGSAASIQGLFTTSPITSQGPSINYAGVQSYTIPGSNAILAEIPFFSGGVPSSPSIPNTGPFPGANCGGVSPLLCPGGTLCACYLIVLPASNPVVGAATSGGTGYSVPAVGQASYAIDAAAAIGSSEACDPNELVSTGFVAGSGGTTTAPEIDLINCQ